MNDMRTRGWDDMDNSTLLFDAALLLPLFATAEKLCDQQLRIHGSFKRHQHCAYKWQREGL